MAKRNSAIEGLTDVAAKLPWWIGVSLALLSFVVLRLVAGMEIAAPKGLNK